LSRYFDESSLHIFYDYTGRREISADEICTLCFIYISRNVTIIFQKAEEFQAAEKPDRIQQYFISVISYELLSTSITFIQYADYRLSIEPQNVTGS
jgi:hypothetical protein